MLALAVRSRLVAAAVVLVLAGVAAACSSDRGALSAPASAPATGSSAPTQGTAPITAIESVAMVGDSITVRSQDALADGFRALGLEVEAIDAASGRRMTADGGGDGSGLTAIAALKAAGPPDLWVIALGTNDVFQYDSADQYRDQMVALLRAIPDDAPIVWVDTYLAGDPAKSEAFNQALRDTLAFRGTSSVAEWAAVAPGDGVLSDGIHPTDQGVQQFAGVVMNAVQPWLS